MRLRNTHVRDKKAYFYTPDVWTTNGLNSSNVNIYSRLRAHLWLCLFLSFNAHEASVLVLDSYFLFLFWDLCKSIWGCALITIAEKLEHWKKNWLTKIDLQKLKVSNWLFYSLAYSVLRRYLKLNVDTRIRKTRASFPKTLHFNPFEKL